MKKTFTQDIYIRVSRFQTNPKTGKPYVSFWNEPPTWETVTEDTYKVTVQLNDERADIITLVGDQAVIEKI